MRLLIAAILMLAALQPAYAGWRWTSWGATIADVQAAYPGDPFGEGGAPVAAEALAAKDFVIVPAEGLNVAVRTNYNEAGKLTSVTEKPVDAADCPAFLSYLEGAYGQAGLAGTRTKWVDAEAENSVTVVAEEADACSIRFSRAPR